MPHSASPATSRPLPKTPLRSLQIGVLSLGALLLGAGAVAPPEARADGGDQGARSSQQRPAPRPNYRTQHVERRSYLQPSLSGIRPPGFGKFARPDTPSHRGTYDPYGVPVAPHTPVVYVPIGSYVTPLAPAQQPVIVVQAPAPQPPPQPVVVQVAAPEPIHVPRPAPAAVEPREPLPPPAPKEPGKLRFTVSPGNAVVYLDDDRLGTAGELREAAPLVVEAGVHVLEIDHPDWSSERLVFAVGSAGDVRVEVDLAEPKASRRTRLREGSS